MLPRLPISLPKVCLLTVPLLLVANASAQTLPNGGSVTGSISVPFEQDSYTLTANAGDTIWLTVADLDAGTLTPKISLFDPSGALVTSSSGVLVGSISRTAGSSGVYSVRIEDGNTIPDETGNYEVNFAGMPGADEHGALVNGGAVSGFISLGDLDTYTFNATAGDYVWLSVVDLDGGTLNPWIGLYDPSGASIATNTGANAAQINRVLGASGTWTVLIRDGNTLPDEIGNFEVHLARIPGANELGSLVNGGAVSSFLSVGDLDTYTFDATAGDYVWLSVVDLDGGTLNPWIGLYDPSGASIATNTGANAAQINRVLGTSGTWTVLIRDGNTLPDEAGNFEVHLARIPGANELGSLVNGGAVSSFLSVGDLDTYTFDATAGDYVWLSVVDLDGGTLNPWIGLYDPSGASIATNAGANAAQINRSIGMSGTWTVLIRDGNTIPDEMGNYEVHLARIPGANENGFLQNGISVSESISTGDLDSYRFLANAGDVATITMTDTGTTTLNPYIALYDPTGALLTSSTNGSVAVISHTLQGAGFYSIIARDGNTIPDKSGSYSIVVDGSGLPVNQVCSAEFPSDPALVDVGGNALAGPNIGSSSEPFNVSLDASQASSPGIYAMVVWSGKLPGPLPTVYGSFYLSGYQVMGISGVHAQSVVNWFPTPTGLVLPNDPALVGTSFAVQGFVGGYSPTGRLSNAILQMIGI